MTEHEFLMDKGVKSLKEKYSVYLIEQWLREYAKEASSDVVEKIKGYEQEANRQVGLAGDDECSKMCSQAMAFAYKSCYQLLKGEE